MSQIGPIISEAQFAGGALGSRQPQAPCPLPREEALLRSSPLLLSSSWLLLGIPGCGAPLAIVAGQVLLCCGRSPSGENGTAANAWATPDRCPPDRRETALTGGLGLALFSGLPLSVLAIHLALPSGTHLTARLESPLRGPQSAIVSPRRDPTRSGASSPSGETAASSFGSRARPPPRR